MAMHDNRNMIPGYCPICDSVPCLCKAFGTSTLNTPDRREQTKPDSVGITENECLLEQMTPEAIGKFASNSVYAKEIWNAAIDAAIAELDIINNIGGAFLVRKLKK